MFAGRADELGQVQEIVDQVEAFGRHSGPPLVFCGPRGTGKTSLLREAKHSIGEPAGFATVWVSCAKDTPMVPDLVSGVERSLRSLDANNSWQTRVDKLTVELGLGPVKIAADLKPHQKSGPQHQYHVGSLGSLLDAAATAVRDQGGAGVALFIDELHAAPQVDLAITLNTFQTLAYEPRSGPVAVFGAGLPSTRGVLSRAATFAERTNYQDLGPLTLGGAAQAVVSPAEQLNVGWEPDAVRQITQASAGFPFFLQLYAHHTWRHARPEKGSTISENDAKVGLLNGYESVVSLYATRWKAASSNERSFITVMAQVRDTAGESTRARMLEVLDEAGAKQFSVLRDRLIDKDIIEAPGHGRLRFTMPGFAEFVVTDGRDLGMGTPQELKFPELPRSVTSTRQEPRQSP